MIIEREAIRAILLTPANEVLLLRIQPPEAGECFWITPGGGLEAGESIEEGLRRELLEEVGLKEFAMGPLVWLREHIFDWDKQRYRQREQYYVVQVPRFEPQVADVIEARHIARFRWWPLTELAEASERVSPLSLSQIVERFIVQGPPLEPLLVETLID